MPYIFISPWIDIFVLALLVYLVEYGFYAWKKANIFETKYMILWLLVDL